MMDERSPTGQLSDAERPAALSAALAGRYVVERELGRGGMATVYLSRDVRHKRPVAVKVLDPELSKSLGTTRFLREIELAANLQHPHVVPLHDSGEAAGLLFYVMPYVDGETLRARLARDGPLRVDEALRLTREVAEALDYAHEQAIVHRDVKPENILLSRGHALVADFGIARAVAQATESSPRETLTVTGLAIGTPAYMSPEQAAGEREVDGRSDVYSLGCVAYEMLTGRTPFSGSSAEQIAARFRETPASLATRRPELPAAADAVLKRALALAPEARFPTALAFAEALTEALRVTVAAPPSGGAHAARPDGPPPRARVWSMAVRRPWPIGVVVLMALGMLVVVWTRFTGRGAAASPPVLVVLPFENLGPPADSSFADGLTEEVRTRLYEIGVNVIGGVSSRQFKGSTKTAREIARDLGATHVLTGTVSWERSADGGGRVRVNPELVRATDQRSVWTERYDGALESIFQVQTRVADRVAAALDVALLAHGQDTAKAPPTRNLAAYDSYLRGIAYAADGNFVSARLRRDAIEALERAVTLDSQFAAAQARLALAYLDEREFGRDTGMLERARASVTRALNLDSGLVASRLAQAQLLTAQGNHEGAYHALTDAARRAPNDPAILYWTGRAQIYLQQPDAAAESFRRAAVLDPRWASPVGQLAGAYDRLGRYDDAIRAREREIGLMPQAMPWTYLYQAATYLLWRADTAAARQMIARGDPRMVVEALTWAVWIPQAGRAIWLDLVPPAVRTAKDTLTLDGYMAANWGTVTPDGYHFMKAAHFALTGRREAARAHADSVIALLEPELRRAPDRISFSFFGHSRQATLAEAYAYAGRAVEAARLIDRYVESVRRDRNGPGAPPPSSAFVAAAYVDVLIGRPDSAVARLTEALRGPSGQWISRPLLRADPSWAPLRGRPDFERLIADR